MQEHVGDSVDGEIKIVDEDDVELQFVEMEDRDQLCDPSEDEERKDNDEGDEDLPLAVLVSRFVGKPGCLFVNVI